LRNACIKTGYNFPLATIKKWLESQKMHQIYNPLSKNTPYTSYSRISKPNCVHQYDLIEIPYDENEYTNLLNEDNKIFYYVLLVIDCMNRYKDFVFLISKSSSEVADAFRNIYENPNNHFIYPQLLQCDEGRKFMGSVTLLMGRHNVKIRRIKARFRHTNLAIVDCYARLFTLRVFKNQYAIEFLLPTSECYRKCEQFARRIVDNMNNTPTQLIGMSPNSAIKLERVYSKPSTKYYCPIGANELQLPKGTIV
ncbi:2438_t:CDS:1, partial [Gigaspora rosea]